ncbi:HelD family protein [Streptomyces sp. NPDC058001]|uniref:HelD family protein n=1 Tax=Streptomyces sp. NPDC058001 TaxID=3346300 RepID=UPI0036E2F12F
MTSPPPPPPPPPDDALTQERAYHDTCRTALAAMVDGADEQVVIGEDVSASGADAEVLGYALRSQAKELHELPDGPLFFGRLDFSGSAGEHAGQRYHIGRLRITEHPSAPPLVVDWRAPVSRAFYQASPRDPRGVAVRRRFGWAQASTGASADLTGLEDEHLDEVPDRAWGEALDAALIDTAAPGGFLAREIERPRIGPMRDIAATIQPEQDDLVRADLTASVCVQGAPGTGKTAVGLHRAAYLLYTHPQRIRRTGLLVLGPNRTFLRYISEVLPALGETGVRQATVEDEIARQPVTAEDPEAAAVVKHDARMAEVLHRALYARVGAVSDTDDLVVPDGSYRWRVPGGALDRIVAEVRAERLPYEVGRERVRTRVVARVRERAERRAGLRGGAWVQRIGRARPVTAYLDTVWPKVRPEEVVAELLSDPGALARAAGGILGADERAALGWARLPRSYKSARWSAADLVLLDEVAGLLEHPGGYGHIVVDEAQDLSPMQCRAIARRARYGSLTVLGDLAQATAPWAVRDWAALLGHLGRPEAPVVPLTVGFRVPTAVVEFANRLLAELDVPVPPGRSLRRDGELRVRRVPDAVAGSVRAVRDALGYEGSVGVIAADAEVERVRVALADAGIEAGGIGAGGAGELGCRVTVLPASLAKGLEYDHVVAVEPAAVAEAEPRGLHRLYVVLTRAVSRLDVVHSRPLPFGA